MKDCVFDVKGETDFAEHVIKSSSRHVVVVDFWAPWCGPCRMLGPAIENAMKAFHGKAVLVKVNLDENRELAEKWSVRSIPAIKCFKDGKVVKDLVGALPEADLRRELSEIIPSEADELISRGDRLKDKGEADKAEDCYLKALAVDPGHPAASVRLAHIALDRRDFEDARNMASSVSIAAGEREEAEAVLAMIGFTEECVKAGGLESAERLSKAEAGNLDGVYSLACCLAADKQYGDALSILLAIAERDKRYGEDKAKKAMVRIFSIIGQRSDMADDYRERLTRTLYA